MAWVLGTLALFVGLGALYMIADVNRRVDVQLQLFRNSQIKELENSIATLVSEMDDLERRIETGEDITDRFDDLRTEIANQIGEIHNKLTVREKELSEKA